MNKKFLSAILFGALVASTGSFVSCADNDGDIKELQDQNSELKAQLAQLKSELQAELKTAASASQVAAIEAKLSALEGVTSDNIAAVVAALKGDFSTQEKVVEALKIQIEAIEKAQLDNAEAVLAELNKAKENANADVAGLSAMVDALDAQVNTLLTDVRSIVFQPEFYVDGIEAVEYTYLKYVPLADNGDARVYGQQVSDKISQADTEYPGGSYVAWDYGKYNSITIKKDFKWAYLHVGDLTSVAITPATYSGTSLETAFYMGNTSSCPDDGCLERTYDWGLAIATSQAAVDAAAYVGKDIINTMYFAVNPANTDVKVEDLNVAVKNVMAMTRANAEVTITKVEPVKDSASASKNEKIVKVEYYISNPKDIITANNDESYSVLNKKENTTIFKLQAQTEAGIVESDWAALYETSIQPVAVALNKKGNDAKWNAPIICTGVENVNCGEIFHEDSHYAKDAADNVYPELHKNPYEALIDEHRTAEIDYRSQGINIAEHIELHLVKRDAEKADRQHKNEQNLPGSNNNQKEVQRPHVTMSLAEAAYKFGFTYEFNLVPYTTDDNKTNNSAYAHLAEAKSGYDKATYGTPVIIPNTVEEDPKLVADQFNLIPKKAVATSTYVSEDGYEQGASSVDRQPLVQVLVKKGNDVILDAYVNFIITRHVGNVIAPLFDLGSKAKSCASINYAMTWNQVSELLYEQTANKTLGMSKLEFEDSYELARYSNGVIAQFNVTETTNVYGEKDYDASIIKYEDTFTEVYEDIDLNGTTTSILKMTLDKYDQQYVYEQTNREYTIWVMYVRKGTGANTTLNGILVPMKIALDENKFTQYDKMNKNFWYAADGTPRTEPDSAMRFNVNTTYDNINSYQYKYNTTTAELESFNGAVVEGFVRDLNDAWEGKRITLGSLKTKPYYYFHPLTKKVEVKDEYDGTIYCLDVKSDEIYCEIWNPGEDPQTYVGNIKNHEHKFDGKVSEQAEDFVKNFEKDHQAKVTKGIYTNTELFAYVKGTTTQYKIAELNPKTGEVWYNHEPFAQRVLNATSHLKAEVKAYVGLYLDQCDATVAKAIEGKEAAYANNVFPVFFLRPLDIYQSEPAQFTDAISNGDYITLFDKFSAIDWRNYDPAVDQKYWLINTKAENNADKYKNVWFFAFYGLNTMTVDLSEIKTNMNGHNFEVKLADVNSDIKFSYVEHNKTTVIAEFPVAGTKTISLSAYNKQSMGVKSTYDALVEHFGLLKYENKGANVSDFDVLIPVTFGYDWGKLQTTLKVHVQGTEGNNE